MPTHKPGDSSLWAPAKAADWLIKEFVENSPKFHLGGEISWSVSAETLRFLEAHVTEGCHTLETGAGLSTVMFAALGAHHLCICPSADEAARIKQFCEDEGISTERLAFNIDFSENVLPNLQTEPLDVVLIDGGHGFPMPAIDWYYTAGKLKQGGIVIIDDTHLWSCGMLVDFLKKDRAWKAMGWIGRRTFAFRKVGEFGYEEFLYQPYVMQKSRLPVLKSKVLVAWDLLTSGDFAGITRRLFKT